MRAPTSAECPIPRRSRAGNARISLRARRARSGPRSGEYASTALTRRPGSRTLPQGKTCGTDRRVHVWTMRFRRGCFFHRPSRVTTPDARDRRAAPSSCKGCPAPVTLFCSCAESYESPQERLPSGALMAAGNPIANLSGPRHISTAMMPRSNRVGYTAVTDEPFYSPICIGTGNDPAAA